MLAKFIDIKGMKTTFPSGSEASVTGLHVTPDLRIVAVEVDFGGILTEDEKIVPFAAMGAADVEAAEWRVNLERPGVAAEGCEAEDYVGIELDLNDGQFGTIRDLVFNLETGDLAFLVVETGAWLAKRQVLVPARKLCSVSHSSNTARVDATREEVENAPDVFENDAIESRAAGTLLTYYGLAA